MAADQTNVHKKINRVPDKLTKLDGEEMSRRTLYQQTKYLGQLVALVRKDSSGESNRKLDRQDKIMEQQGRVLENIGLGIQELLKRTA